MEPLANPCNSSGQRDFFTVRSAHPETIVASCSLWNVVRFTLENWAQHTSSVPWNQGL